MKKATIALVCLCLLFLTGFAGYRGYMIGKPGRLVTQARAFIAKSDAPNALLCLRQALQTNPNNLEALRLMADFAEAARSPQAVVWRRRVVDLAPTSFNDRIALARTALWANDPALAQRALDGVDDAGKRTVDYHNASGAVDLVANRFAAAEAHFSEAAQLDPANPGSQLRLAILRLQSTNEQTAATARADLDSLCTNTTVRCEALRQLRFDALRLTNLTAALALSQAVLAETNSGFSDSMAHLDILRASTNSDQRAFLRILQTESTNNPAKAYELAKSMVAAGESQDALAWLKSLPPATRTNLPVPMIEADCYIAMKDWAGLLATSMNQTWRELDCLRLICRARAFKEQGQTASAKAEWLGALKATENSREMLVQLLNTTTLWKWTAEQEDVLWGIVNRYPSEQWAVQNLTERLFAAGRTRSLLRLFGQMSQSDSTNVAVLNNLAMTALLLEAWDKRPYELAQAAYQKCPTNPPAVSTYAYSLLVQKKPEEALATMEQLQPGQLEDPGIAAYYGIILSRAGQGEKAKKYLELAAKARLLPEEQKLVERAMQ